MYPPAVSTSQWRARVWPTAPLTVEQLSRSGVVPVPSRAAGAFCHHRYVRAVTVPSLLLGFRS
ncbi:hypothetical protein ACIBO2_24875 [Nonomuraea sp. NPDC050022]|uniref:hypothetical protein n=1 Tax=Nonomuraea sp. NPDC050022 TaxID=3364358 RepID=UPI0037B5F801